MAARKRRGAICVCLWAVSGLIFLFLMFHNHGSSEDDPPLPSTHSTSPVKLTYAVIEETASEAFPQSSPPSTTSSQKRRTCSTYYFLGQMWTNRSLRTDPETRMHHQCPVAARYSPSWTPPPKRAVHFTPDRHWVPDPVKNARGIVVLLLGGEGRSKFNAQMQLQIFSSRWDSWCEFLMPLPLVVVILLDREAHISASYLAERLSLVKLNRTKEESRIREMDPTLCGLEDLDEGYSQYRWTVTLPGGINRTGDNLIIGPVLLDAPLWVHDIGRNKFFLRHMNRFRVHSKCVGSMAFYSYIQTNRFYTHQVFLLELLDLFDVWLKVDADVQFLTPLPVNPITEIIEKRALIMHSGMVPLLNYCTTNIQVMVDTYLALESEHCGFTLLPVEKQAQWFVNESVAFHGNFFGGWLGYHQSAEFLHFSRYFNIFPHGLWKHRWTDQEMWSKAFGLIGNETRILDLSPWRNRNFTHNFYVFNYTGYVEYMAAHDWKLPRATANFTWTF